MNAQRVAGLAVAIVLTTVAVSCDRGSGGGGDTTTATAAVDTTNFAAQVASTDLSIDRDERVQVGVFSSTQDGGVQLLTFGSVQLSFSFLGEDGGAPPEPGPSAIADYLAAPTTDTGGTTPALSAPDQARGVYQATAVRFDKAGVWSVKVTADVEGIGAVDLEANFQVKTEPSLPAPGQRALATKNLTMASKGAEPVSIDSRAQGDEPVPDPAQHRWTIAKALDQGQPALVLFATPVYCVSQFCGPTADALTELATAYPDKAAFIHIEIWKDFEASTANQAALDWLLHDGDLTEPWLYLIGADGTIADRWGPLFNPDEVAAELQALPSR